MESLKTLTREIWVRNLHLEHMILWPEKFRENLALKTVQQKIAVYLLQYVTRQYTYSSLIHSFPPFEHLQCSRPIAEHL